LLLLAIAAQDQTPSERGGRAGLVVRYDDQRVESRCVALDAAEISGYDLLQDSGLALDVKSAGQGGLVCAIEGTGCGPDNCLCQCQGEPCIYWSYWRLGDEGWAYSAVGATVRRVSDGQVDGWSWGPGSVTSAIEPPETTFEEICSNDVQLFSSPAAATRQTGPASWLPYVVLGLLLAIIGGGAWLASKRRADS
jgi:LPXTG-motif cell wall-anchored protein